MKRLPVSSRGLKSIGYDPKTKILEIEFKSKLLAQYFDVPASTYEALMLADSKGAYFGAYIRDVYSHQRVKEKGPFAQIKAMFKSFS
ncbi:MAG: KTSC domain-containing protein [Chloroflexi bacterium]|nr:KTSC domain-containing protein [Chloroflexota bacterium]